MIMRLTRNSLRLIITAVTLMFCGVDASAQLASAKCRGPIFSREDVTTPARIVDQPNFRVLYKALGNDVSGRVRLEAVLCRSGRVTDIRVVESRPTKELGEFVAAALSLVRFKPAELKWHTVSQRHQFEFSFNEDDASRIDSVAAAGRLVEELDIMGNRRITKEEILALVKTRPGEIYQADQVEKDLMAILATGYFNALSTRVTIEDAARGGVRVTFEVMELPLITEVRFEGLKFRDESAVINEFDRQRVDLRRGRPLDIAQIKKATHVIEQFFQSQGWANVKAEAFTQNLSATEVQVVFKISGRTF